MQFYMNNKKFLGDKDKNSNTNRKSEINSAKKKDQ